MATDRLLHFIKMKENQHYNSLINTLKLDFTSKLVSKIHLNLSCFSWHIPTIFTVIISHFFQSFQSFMAFFCLRTKTCGEDVIDGSCDHTGFFTFRYTLIAKCWPLLTLMRSWGNSDLVVCMNQYEVNNGKFISA